MALFSSTISDGKARQSLRPKENLNEFRELDRRHTLQRRIEQIVGEIDRLMYQLLPQRII